MFVEQVFNRQGCLDPQTIAYWNDNCIFADEHGVHMTDGSIIRNLVTQGGILYYWRMLYQNKQTICGGVFLDYYILTIRRTDGIVDTLVCDLNKRQWFRFSNIPALCYIASAGGANMERLWAGLAGKGRLARLGPVLLPGRDDRAGRGRRRHRRAARSSRRPGTGSVRRDASAHASPISPTTRARSASRRRAPRKARAHLSLRRGSRVWSSTS